MNKLRVGLTLPLLLVLFVTGCGITLSPVKRKPLEIAPMQAALTSSPQMVQVVFADVLPGTPLSETVWDNGIGPFADPVESRRIGYTQDYVQAAVGGAAAMVQPSYTRLVIPFGRIFEGVFQSGLKKVFPNSPVGIEKTNQPETVLTKGYAVQLKVVNFKVWEDPLNHINMQGEIECRCRPVGATGQKETVYVARHEIIRQSIGVLPTSGSIVKKLESMANGFAATLSEDTLEHLQKEISQ